jgi:imidazole glycerol phosphate synthase subunit HisF
VLFVANDAKRRQGICGWDVYLNGGSLYRQGCGEWAIEAERLGAGEMFADQHDATVLKMVMKWELTKECSKA